MKHHEFELTTVSGQRLVAQSWTPAAKPWQAVGIVHGLGEHSGRYAHVAQALTDAGLVVCTYDQRGHGRSRHGASDNGLDGSGLPSFDVLRCDIDVLIASMQSQGYPKPFLMGQSMGGGLVLNLAVRRPSSLSGVIAMSPMLRTAFTPPMWKLAVARWLGRVWPRLTLGNGLNADDLSHDRTAVQQYLDDPLVHRRISAALGLSMLESGEWTLEHADQLQLPVLLMHGTGDRITSAAASQLFAERAGQRCTLELWPNLYHDLHHELERDQVLQRVIDWLRAQSQPPQSELVDTD